MMKNLHFVFLMLLSSLCFGQISFSDDFEAYDEGAYLGQSSADWTTWSNAPGGAEDVRIVSDQAYSGTNSIYFNGSGQGGPADVILPFGGKHTSGQFNMSLAMFVVDGRTGYFNFQGETTPGTTWTMNVNFQNDGSLVVDDGVGEKIRAKYPIGQWFELEIDVNLTNNVWKFVVNGACVGSYASEQNYLASCDLFPLGTSSFYVDDVSYDYQSEADAPATLDMGIAGELVGAGGIVGTERHLTANITNNGTEVIHTFDISLSSGSLSDDFNFENMSIQPGETVEVDLGSYTFQEDVNEMLITASNINGNSTDGDDCNNRLNPVFISAVPAPGKRVVVEEGTGTWCGFCPRGTVFMEAMEEKYPDHFVGIAVHNRTTDPMLVPEYDAGMGLSGYPGAKVNRGADVDPSDIELPILQSIQDAPLGTMEIGAQFDEMTRELKVSVKTTINSNTSVDYHIAVPITENNVSGTESGYAQANYYANNALGPMGGYENLPDPVPASQMVYHQVARAILGGFDGAVLETGNMSTGDAKILNFSYTVPMDYDLQNMYINSLLILPNGRVDNGYKISVSDAIQNGFETSSVEDPILAQGTVVFPNPFTNQTSISLNLEKSERVVIKVYDSMGKLVREKDYGVLQGEYVFPFDGENLKTGIYHMQILAGDKFTIKKISVQK